MEKEKLELNVIDENQEQDTLEKQNKSDDGDHLEYENISVPQEKRKSLFTMIIIMAGFATFSATIWTGAEIAASFNLGMLILISIIGNVILASYIGALAYLGGETGLSTHSLSKRAFGNRGSYLPSILALLGQLGWFGVGVMMFVSPIMAIIQPHVSDFNYQLIQWTIILGSGALMIASAFMGVRALKWVSIVAVPLVLVFGILMMILSATSTAGAIWGTGGITGDMSFATAIGLVFATFVSGGTLAPDFVRWAKNGKEALISVILAFLVVSTLMLIFGGFAYYGTGKTDLSDALYVMGLAPIAFVVLGANIWTTNDNGLYTQGLAASSVTGIDKKWNIIFLGVVGTLLAPMFNNHFVPFLDFLNLMLPGIGTILILNGFWFKEDNTEKTMDWKPISAWAIGLMLGWILNILIPFALPLYIIFTTSISYIAFYYIQKAIDKE